MLGHLVGPIMLARFAHPCVPGCRDAFSKANHSDVESPRQHVCPVPALGVCPGVWTNIRPPTTPPPPPDKLLKLKVLTILIYEALTQLTEEQRERIEANRQEALRRKRARLQAAY